MVQIALEAETPLNIQGNWNADISLVCISGNIVIGSFLNIIN
jgi:hypothetical protein